MKVGIIQKLMCNTDALMRHDWVWYIVKHFIKMMKTTWQPVFNCHKAPSKKAAILHNFSIRQFYRIWQMDRLKCLPFD